MVGTAKKHKFTLLKLLLNALNTEKSNLNVMTSRNEDHIKKGEPTKRKSTKEEENK